MDKSKLIIIGVLVLLIGAIAAMRYNELPGKTPAPSTPPASAGLKVTDLKDGTGKAAKSGDRVSVHYIGTLTNGTKFDASRDHGKPFEFTLGAGDVIKGWDEGVAGMKEGGKRKLVVPPELGYGARGAGGVIPPNATLIFEIELLKVG